MSIWATIFDLEDDPPYVYQGSHVLPADDDPRDDGDAVQLALVPSHITRDGRDDRPEDGVPWPWLRLSLRSEDTVLGRSQVAEMHRALGAWLEQTQPPTTPTHHNTTRSAR
ncbi:hypothetical protein ACTWJ9_33200 (plasmid) [Streptomyces sp. GDS52]|uniref:hypothetical protein n=1 Tax=Streptomyces sp. GDS52 TaxID=3406419 RepID=UPI003FD5F7FA